MGCCGNRRQQISSGKRAGTNHFQETTVNVAGTALRYVGNASILVRGNHSGRSYFFSTSQPEQVVKSGDVNSLLSTGLFRSTDGS